MIGEDIHMIAGQLFRVWHFFLSLVPFCKKYLNIALMRQWQNFFIERWGSCIFRERLTIRDRTRVVSTSLSEHEMVSKKVREQQSMFGFVLPHMIGPPLQDTRYMLQLNPKNRAVIFEQTYNLPDNKSYQSVRLIDTNFNNQFQTKQLKNQNDNQNEQDKERNMQPNNEFSFLFCFHFCIFFFFHI